MKTMSDITSQIADVLLGVEATLRQHGKWDEQQPPEDALISKEPFCIDTLPFEQWLQWIFIPRMKQILEDENPLPEKSDIFVYAQESLRYTKPPMNTLLDLIKEFDELITEHEGVVRH